MGHFKVRIFVVTGALLFCVSMIAGTVFIGIELRMRWTLDELDGELDNDRVRAILDGLGKPPFRARKLARYFAGWGNRSESYDLSVMTMLIKTSDKGALSMDNEIIDAINAKLKEDKSVLRQVYWHDRWTFGRHLSAERRAAIERKERENMNGVPSFLIRYRTDLVSQSYSNAEKVVVLFSVASMLNAPELVEDLDMQHVDERWSLAIAQLNDNGP